MAHNCKWLYDSLQTAAITCSHLQLLAATCSPKQPQAAPSSHLQPLATTCSHLRKQPRAATCSHSQTLAPGPLAATRSHLQPLAPTCRLAVWASGCRSGCKWLLEQVAASGCKRLLFRKPKWSTFARSLGKSVNHQVYHLQMGHGFHK